MNIAVKKINMNMKEYDIKDFLLQPSTHYQVAPNPKTKIGRPVFEGKNENEVVAKLQFAFSIGAITKEACSFADISTDSFYRYCKKYPEFRSKTKLLQTTPNLLARVAIYNKLINGDAKISKWYLERKSPAEYSVNGSLKYQLQEKIKRIEYLESVLRVNKIGFNY